MFLEGSLFCGQMDAAGTNSRGKDCRKENTVKNRRETIQQKIPGRFSALGDLADVNTLVPAIFLYTIPCSMKYDKGKMVTFNSSVIGMLSITLLLELTTKQSYALLLCRWKHEKLHAHYRPIFRSQSIRA